MNLQKTEASYAPYIKSAAIATSLTVIPIAIAIILGSMAFYGHLGPSAQSLIHLKILPYLQGFTGFVPNVSLTLFVGGAITALGFYVIFSITLARFMKKPADAPREVVFSRTVNLEAYSELEKQLKSSPMKSLSPAPLNHELPLMSLLKMAFWVTDISSITF